MPEPDVSMQEIPAIVRAAVDSRTHAVLAKQQEVFAKPGSATCPNSKKWRVQVAENNGSSGRTRTYNPSVNSRIVGRGTYVFSVTYMERAVVFGAPSAHIVSQILNRVH